MPSWTLDFGIHAEMTGLRHLCITKSALSSKTHRKKSNLTANPLLFAHSNFFWSNPICFSAKQIGFGQFQLVFGKSNKIWVKVVVLADSTAFFRNAKLKTRFPIDLDAKPVCFSRPLSGKPQIILASLPNRAQLPTYHSF